MKTTRGPENENVFGSPQIYLNFDSLTFIILAELAMREQDFI